MSDAALSMCSPASRGIWFDLLCVLHELGRSGQVTGTAHQLARACRCTSAEFVAAIAELSTTGAAEIHERNGEVTIINRRMKREHKERQQTAERVRRHRCNDPVTPSETGVKRESNKPPESRDTDIHVNNISQENISDSKNKSISSERSEEASEKPKAKSKRPKEPPDPRSQHPAIQACRLLTTRYPPKVIWDDLIKTLGEMPDALKMRECCTEWVKRGYNQNAWTWALNWYAEGIPQRTFGSSYGNNSSKTNGVAISNRGSDSSESQFQAKRRI